MVIFENIKNYATMVKFSHTLFALPFAFISVVLSLKENSISKDEFLFKLFLILICMVSARNAAMGFNRLVDSEIDKNNPRTQNREIPAGKISKKSVLLFTIIFSLIFIFSTYFINSFSFIASIPTLIIILGYSFTKRFTWICHYILGLGIGLAPLAAGVAMQNKISILPLFFSVGLMFHISGFDILYSIQDIEYDKANGLYSIPSRFGVQNSLIVSRMNHIISFLVLVYAGMYGQMNYSYFIFIVIAGILFIIEHILVRVDDLTKIPIAFFHINASISSILFLGIIIDNWKFLWNYFG